MVEATEEVPSSLILILVDRKTQTPTLRILRSSFALVATRGVACGAPPYLT